MPHTYVHTKSTSERETKKPEKPGRPKKASKASKQETGGIGRGSKARNVPKRHTVDRSRSRRRGRERAAIDLVCGVAFVCPSPVVCGHRRRLNRLVCSRDSSAQLEPTRANRSQPEPSEPDPTSRQPAEPPVDQTTHQLEPEPEPGPTKVSHRVSRAPR